MTSLPSHNTPEVEPKDEEIRKTIIDEGIIKSIHGIEPTYVKRVENCGQWKNVDY